MPNKMSSEEQDLFQSFEELDRDVRILTAARHWQKAKTSEQMLEAERYIG